MDLEKFERVSRWKHSDSTVNSKMSALRRFDEWLGNHREPSAKDVEKWIDSLKQQCEHGELKASTVDRYYGAVRSYFEVVHGDSESLDYIRSSLPDNSSKTPVYLTEYEFKRLQSNLRSARNRAFVEILYRYARSSQEVLLLNREDIDLERETITFRTPKRVGSQLPSLQVAGDTYRVQEFSCSLEDETIDHLDLLFRYLPNTTQEMCYRGESKEVKPLFWGQKRRVTYGAMNRAIKKAADRAYLDKNVTPSMIRLSRMVHLYRSNEMAGLFAGEWLEEKYGIDFLSEISSSA